MKIKSPAFAHLSYEAAKESAERVGQQRLDKVREYRREASRKASVANKRLQRLEKNNLTDSPAYQQYIKSGGGRFGVKGKSYNEIQREVSRLDKFLNSQTSTIKGINTNLKEMAANTGIKYKNLTDLRAKASKFFELASKVEQYLRTVEDMASAIGYQKIWEQVNVYVQKEKKTLENADDDIDQMIKDVTKALKEYEDPIKVRNRELNKTLNFKMLK